MTLKKNYDGIIPNSFFIGLTNPVELKNNGGVLEVPHAAVFNPDGEDLDFEIKNDNGNYALQLQAGGGTNLLTYPTTSDFLFLGADTGASADGAAISLHGKDHSTLPKTCVILCDVLKINADTGWNGTFTNGDAKTVTVRQGIIINVV